MRRGNVKASSVALGIGAILSFFVAAGVPAQAAENLESELDSLSLPANEVPAHVSQEKLYAVQSRYSPLKGRSEIGLGGSMNFTADSFVSSNQLELSYRYHLNDRWSLGAEGSAVFNSYSSAGERLLSVNHELPDTAYVKYRGEVAAGFNAFYGKFRLSMDRVFYFDQYFTLGPGYVRMDTGSSLAAVGGAGFVFWIGRTASVRLGLKDYFYHQKRRLGEGMVHDLVGHLDVGILLGSGGAT